MRSEFDDIASGSGNAAKVVVGLLDERLIGRDLVTALGAVEPPDDILSVPGKFQ